MMGSVMPETCRASFKIRNNKTLVHCCILLGFSVRTVVRCTDPRTSRVCFNMSDKLNYSMQFSNLAFLTLRPDFIIHVEKCMQAK
jgi:hypothetical protein